MEILVEPVIGDLRPPVPEDPLEDDDLQLALYLSYEMHYRGVAGVPDAHEWHPAHLQWRGALEQMMLDGLQRAIPRRQIEWHEVADALRALDAGASMSVARFVEREASLAQVQELVVHRSAYHLKEADPHTFALPRLSGAAKAAFAEVQVDEYGGGRPDRVHSVLFGDMMTGLGLDRTYGAYLDRIPGYTLATVNIMSFFGLHRAWRGAAVGHLALFELTSAVPNRRYGNGLRRLGFGPAVTDFHDEHVEADAVHSMIATYDLAARLVEDDPTLAADVMFGADSLVHLDSEMGDRLLAAWTNGHSTLRPVGNAS